MAITKREQLLRLRYKYKYDTPGSLKPSDIDTLIDAIDAALDEVIGISTGEVTISYEEQDTAALLALSDGDLATAAIITQDPLDGDYIKVYIDGIKFSVGRGNKTKPFYFSADGGVTAKGFSESDPTGKVEIGDALYVNPSILTATLDPTQTITIVYNITQ